MAEGFEVYHVPQQSRRDKLRVGNSNTNSNNNFQISSNSLPLYDPSSLISSHDFPINHTTPFHDINPSLYHTAAYSGIGIGIGIGSGGGGDDDDVTLFKHHSEVEPLSLELNLQRYGSFTSSSSINVTNHHHHDSSSSVVPLGPFTGYASILKGSKFLKPAQVLLQDLFDYGGRLGNNIDVDDDDKLVISDNSSFMDPLLENLDADFVNSLDHHDPISCSEDGTDSRRRKSRLISMLDEVYRRYKQYYQQMQAVVTTFEYVAGLGNAAPYVNLAVKSMFKHFRLLKNAIADQLQFSNNKPYNPYCQRSVQNAAGFLDHHQPVWRPQRGLPESAVTVLRAWLFEHFLHPYPTDTDKLMLANQTGLSRSQVSNWFINARVRLWKPMVEEIHMLETRQAAQKSQQREGGNGNGNGGNRLNNDHVSSTNSLKPGQNIASTSNQDHRNELIQDMAARNEPLNSLSNPNIFSTHPHAAAGASMGGGSVSLTLGLHQNNVGIGLSEPFPINAAQHFNIGLEGNGEGFVMSGFGAENRHFVRNGIGGQMLHDFVG